MSAQAGEGGVRRGAAAVDAEQERIRAHAKHSAKGKSAEQMPWTDPFWLPVLVEEVGEVARAMCDRESPARVREEMIQVAAMALAWADAIQEAIELEASQAMTQVEKCRYMEAAYPDLDDACEYGHRHEQRVFDLARALAKAMHGTENPRDEQIGWFLDDANAVVDDFDPTPDAWTATTPGLANETGLDWQFTINGRDYVVLAAEYGPEHPIARAKYEAWMSEDPDE